LVVGVGGLAAVLATFAVVATEPPVKPTAALGDPRWAPAVATSTIAVAMVRAAAAVRKRRLMCQVSPLANFMP
jgi:hypothetical protein